MRLFSFLGSGVAGIFSALFVGGNIIKEKMTPVIPASYWRNKELMNSDKLNPNISPEQVMKNLERGKYYLSDAEYERRQKEKENFDWVLKRKDETYAEYYERVDKERAQRKIK